MAPPKKRRNQSRAANGMNVVRNGIGAAENRHKRENSITIFIDFAERKPPRYVQRLPPTTTPNTGPVMLMMLKEMNTLLSATPNY